MTVAATDEYLDAHMPRPWVFEKSEGGFSVKQPSLCDKSAQKLGDLLEKIRRAAAAAKPFTY